MLRDGIDCGCVGGEDTRRGAGRLTDLEGRHAQQGRDTLQDAAPVSGGGCIHELGWLMDGGVVWACT